MPSAVCYVYESVDGFAQTRTKVSAREVGLLFLSVGAADHVHQFRDLPALVRLVAGMDRVFHTMSLVIPQDFLFDASQGGACRCDLRHHIDAIAVGLDHIAEAADLTFDAFQPFSAG